MGDTPQTAESHEQAGRGHWTILHPLICVSRRGPRPGKTRLAEAVLGWWIVSPWPPPAARPAERHMTSRSDEGLLVGVVDEVIYWLKAAATSASIAVRRALTAESSWCCCLSGRPTRTSSARRRRRRPGTDLRCAPDPAAADVRGHGRRVATAGGDLTRPALAPAPWASDRLRPRAAVARAQPRARPVSARPGFRPSSAGRHTRFATRRARDRVMRWQNPPQFRGQRRRTAPARARCGSPGAAAAVRGSPPGQRGAVQLFAGRLQQRPDSQQPVWLLDPVRSTAIGGFADDDDEPPRWRDSPVLPGLLARDLHGFDVIRLAIAAACHQRRSSDDRQREVPGRASVTIDPSAAAHGRLPSPWGNRRWRDAVR